MLSFATMNESWTGISKNLSIAVLSHSLLLSPVAHTLIGKKKREAFVDEEKYFGGMRFLIGIYLKCSNFLNMIFYRISFVKLN